MSMSRSRRISSGVLRLLVTGCLALSPLGCTTLVSGITSRMADDLSSSILNSNDIDTVREGVPAYLLMIDSFLRSDPDSERLLLAAAALNGAFTLLVEDASRVRRLSEKSLGYAIRAACVQGSPLCEARSLDFRLLDAAVAGLKASDVPVAYAIGVAWVGWIRAHSDDWVAISQLGKAKLLMQRIIELDEHYENGGPHLYMGGMETQLPASLGGNPEKGRQHFERALEINDAYLMTRVVFAEQYARLTFDRALHDRLLQEVLMANPVADGMTLANHIARQRAGDLLKAADDYF